jgi:serine/threonine protein kinase
VGTSYGGRLASGHPVVVKVITRRFRQKPQLLEEIKKDLRAFLGFRQANVVSTVDVGRYEDRDVVLFEHAPGVTVEALIKQRGRIDVQTTLRIARDVAMGLAYAHSRGLTIGDIRPSKVYFDPQKGAQLADLGQFRASCLAAGFGQHGLAFGHPTYLAPEILQENLFTPTTRSDVYALGITVYEMLNGHPPFTGEVVEVLHQHLDQPLPPPTNSQEVTPSLAGWLLNMTAKRPTARFGDGKAVVNSLYALLGKPGPFPDVPVMDSGLWARQATEHAAAPSEWSESRVTQAPPAAPQTLLEELTTSGLLDRPEITDISEFPEPEPEPPSPSTEAPGPLQVRLGQKIGRGPAGTLYRGDLRGHKTPVAIKVLTRRFAKHPELLEQILSDLRRVEKLDLTGLVRILHVANITARDLVIMDMAQGKRLREVLKAEGRLDPVRALDVVAGIAQTLGHVWEKKKVVHGDLRPEKVWIDGDKVRLADLGFARASCLAANFGQFGLHYGHPAYLAPEALQERREKPDFLGEAYALGVMLYEMVCGRVPFRGRDSRETLLLHLNQKPPPPPRELAVPTPLAELMLRLMSKQPSLRPESPRALTDAVNRCKKQMMLTTGLRKVVAVDEFDLADSGDEASSTQWQRQATRQAERTGTWSRDNIGNALGDQFELGDLFASEETDPGANPFA